MAGAVGRPRRSAPRRAGKNPREEILDASAELFTRQGFATTSTHQIADAVGIRQASLYYHFPSKTEIFLTLLKSTVEPSGVLAEDLSTLDERPEVRLWAMVAAEVRLLLSTKWNVGRLYQLPIVASAEFAEYHADREQLIGTFQALAREIVGDDPRAELPFHITMAAIEMRPNDGTVPEPLREDFLPETAVMLADASLAVLGADLPDNRVDKALELIRQSDAH
jgi:Transcriptional regulator